MPTSVNRYALPVSSRIAEWHCVFPITLTTRYRRESSELPTGNLSDTNAHYDDRRIEYQFSIEKLRDTGPWPCVYLLYKLCSGRPEHSP